MGGIVWHLLPERFFFDPLPPFQGNFWGKKHPPAFRRSLLAHLNSGAEGDAVGFAMQYSMLASTSGALATYSLVSARTRAVLHITRAFAKVTADDGLLAMLSSHELAIAEENVPRSTSRRG